MSMNMRSGAGLSSVKPLGAVDRPLKGCHGGPPPKRTDRAPLAKMAASLHPQQSKEVLRTIDIGLNHACLALKLATRILPLYKIERFERVPKEPAGDLQSSTGAPASVAQPRLYIYIYIYIFTCDGEFVIVIPAGTPPAPQLGQPVEERVAVETAGAPSLLGCSLAGGSRRWGRIPRTHFV